MRHFGTKKTLLTNSFTLPARLPAGTYRAWVRAIRTEGRNVYRSTWSSSIIIQVADDSALWKQHLVSNLPSLVTQPLFPFAIADSDSPHPEAVSNSERNAVIALLISAGTDEFELIAPVGVRKTESEISDLPIIDFVASGNLDWLSADHLG